MIEQIGAARMRAIAEILKKELKGLGFALIVFEFNKPGMTNYISNADRPDMIKGLDETVARLKSRKDFKTPEEN